jgi:hypothetical protein
MDVGAGGAAALSAAALATVLRSRGSAAAFLLAALVAIGWSAWREQAALGVALAALAARPGLAALSLVGYVGFVLLLAALWRALVLRLGGGPLAPRAALAVQSAAWSARYLPGKLGLVAAKVLLLPGDRVAAAWAVAYEQVLFLGAGAAVVAACAGGALALRSALLPGAAPLVVLAALGLALLLVARGAPLLDRVVAARVGGDVAPRLHPGAGELALRLAGFAGAHALVGLGFVALLDALGHGDRIGPLQAIGALTAAHLGGIIAVFAPAGLGVRELLLAALLAPALGLPEATAVALVTRAWATLGDLLIAPLALTAPRRGP